MKRWSILRIPNVYGEGCRPLYNSVVATFAYNIVNGKEVILRNENVSIEFIYIDELLKYLLAPAYWEYIYPKGETMTVRQIYDYLTVKLGEHTNLKKVLDYFREKQNEKSIN